MPTYILKYPGPPYTGFVHGVDFVNGLGSTSDVTDAQWLVQQRGCGVVHPKDHQLAAGAGTPAPVPKPGAADYTPDAVALASVGIDPSDVRPPAVPPAPPAPPAKKAAQPAKKVPK